MARCVGATRQAAVSNAHQPAQNAETGGLWCVHTSMKWCLMAPAHDALLASIGACVSGMASVIGVLVSVTFFFQRLLSGLP